MLPNVHNSCKDLPDEEQDEEDDDDDPETPKEGEQEVLEGDEVAAPFDGEAVGNGRKRWVQLGVKLRRRVERRRQRRWKKR